MKRLALTTVLLATAVVASAQETGRVISTTPVIQQVAVPRQVCTDQVVTTPGSKSGAGAVMGAVAGGAVGNAVGDGGGRAVATMIGLVGGAILGNKIEGAGPSQTQTVQSCSTQTVYENRTMSYNVVYEFNGKQYTVNMPHDPGPFVKLQITPISSAPATVYVTPALVPASYVVQPVYRNSHGHSRPGHHDHRDWR